MVKVPLSTYTPPPSWAVVFSETAVLFSMVRLPAPTYIPPPLPPVLWEIVPPVMAKVPLPTYTPPPLSWAVLPRIAPAGHGNTAASAVHSYGTAVAAGGAVAHKGAGLKGQGA